MLGPPAELMNPRLHEVPSGRGGVKVGRGRAGAKSTSHHAAFQRGDEKEKGSLVGMELGPDGAGISC